MLVATRDAKPRAAGVPAQFHLRRDQPHNYAAMPTPEGQQARAIILRAVAQVSQKGLLAERSIAVNAEKVYTRHCRIGPERDTIFPRAYAGLKQMETTLHRHIHP